MHMIVVGCGRLGAGVAHLMFQKNHHVVVIDHEQSAFNNLPSDFRGRTIEGDALNQGVLVRAGIQHADGIAAVTNSDSVNVVISHVAKAVFSVPSVISRNYDPRLFSIHEAFALQTISSTRWGAQRIQELLESPNIHSFFSAGNGEVELFEVLISESNAGKKIDAITIQGECLPVALTRAGNAFIPDQDTILAAGDLIQVSATAKGLVKLQVLLQNEGGR